MNDTFLCEYNLLYCMLIKRILFLFLLLCIQAKVFEAYMIVTYSDNVLYDYLQLSK